MKSQNDRASPEIVHDSRANSSFFFPREFVTLSVVQFVLKKKKKKKKPAE